MKLPPFFRSFGASRPTPRPDHAPVCGPVDLEKALRRERSRTTRIGGEFAVISFSSDGVSDDPERFAPLIKNLQSRSRSIDAIGWNQEGKLCYILPQCSEESAVIIASTICKQFSTRDHSISYTLFHSSADVPEFYSAQRIKRNECPQPERRDPFAGDAPTAGSSAPAPANGASMQSSAFSVDELFEQPMPSWKRLSDIVASAIGLIVLAPVFAVIAVAIKLNSQGPVFFVQLRSGRAGRPFRIYKFRSMVADAEERKSTLLTLNEQDGPAFKMENDPRITKVGRFLRATSLDELPQLWNVLRGEMSLVGPRPLPLSESAACESWQRQRMEVTPGLTCFWQIKDRRAKIPFADWARMDIQYAGRRSLWVDLRLIVRTVLFVLGRKGV